MSKRFFYEQSNRNEAKNINYKPFVLHPLPQLGNVK